MGLDAAVRCRCWEDGNTISPPPFVEHVRVDSEGLLELDLPWKENLEKHRAFHEWRRTCCAHPDMEQASEYLSNWTGYRLFQQQIRAFGVQHFPVLAEVLPEVNGGLAPAEKAAAVLEELDKFCAQDFGEEIELVVLDTGEAIHSYVEAYDGVFLFAPTGRAGVDPSGFFVRYGQEERQIEVFRSMRFSQEQLGPKEFKLIDVATGLTTVTALGVRAYLPEPSGRQEFYPTQFEVRRRQMTCADFFYILKPLRIVFKASLETGNPVRWQ